MTGGKMTTDLTRSTFDASKRYSAVRLQQGRMQLDADWNEQIDIAMRREAVTVADVVGPSGGPLDGAGFALAADAAGLSPEDAANPANQSVPAVAAGDFLITAGRYYVGGALIENSAITTYLGQSDLPGLAPLAGDGIHLAWLEVWERPVTALEDAAIREVALGGPDTATRTQRIWQLRTVRVADAGATVSCTDDFAAFTEATAAPTGRLAARAEPDAAPSGPCIVPETAGYRSLENQLYRVEVHRAGTRTTARFKWSRENASVAVAWTGQTGPELAVSTTGPDRPLGFANGDWVELIDAGRELRGEAGTLVRVIDLRDGVLVIDPATADGPTTLADFPTLPRIRRWDGAGAFQAPGAAWADLEQGVQVRFSTGNFRVGDHWLIPARVNLGDVEWPVEGGAPALRPPAGRLRTPARLALLTVSGGTVTAVEDCRKLFPPLTGLVRLDYVGGDGQEGVPDLTNPAAGADLPHPLQVGVSNGGRPVAGARVAFTVTDGGGRVNGAATAEATTGPDGIAAVAWRLGHAAERQRVEARLLRHDGTPVHVPVRFGASFATAAGTAFDPANCPPLTDARTVQEAIDLMCGMQSGPEPGFHIDAIRWAASGEPYRHDGVVDPEVFARGLDVRCSDVIDPATIGRRPVMFVEIHASAPNFGTPAVTVAHRPASFLEAEETELRWRLTDEAHGLIPDILGGQDDRALCELTIRGNNIRAAQPAEDGSPRWLDAEGLESPGREILPSGDTRRGGTLVSWFWVGRPETPPRFGFVDIDRVLPPDSLVRGRLVERESGTGLEQIAVRLFRTGGTQVDETVTVGEGAFLFRGVPTRALTLRATVGDEEVAAEVEGVQFYAASDFTVTSVRDLEELSNNMRTRLVRAGLEEPASIANLDAATLAARLEITEGTAQGVIQTIRQRAL